ncbi:MAG: CoA-transferase [Chloroflexota bacterium]
MPKMTADYTVSDLMASCIAHQVNDGDVVVQGIATPLVMAAYLLAKRTHARNIIFASAIGNAICSDWAPLSLSGIEDVWVGKALRQLTFPEIVCECLPTLKPKEFLRPAQIDPWGNTNNVAIGNYHRPRLRLPGCGGIADVTTYYDELYFYVPRHGRATFVKRLDFKSGLGVSLGGPGAAAKGRYLVSDLGTFDFNGGRLRLVTYHPGVTLESIQAKTGFPLAIAPDLKETPAPTAEELRLLRQELDPLDIRSIECLSGPARWARLREIANLELS